MPCRQHADRLPGRVAGRRHEPGRHQRARAARRRRPFRSGAEMIADVAPDGTRLVKAFNTTFAGTLARGRGRRPPPLDVFLAGDDDEPSRPRGARSRRRPAADRRRPSGAGPGARGARLPAHGGAACAGHGVRLGRDDRALTEARRGARGPGTPAPRARAGRSAARPSPPGRRAAGGDGSFAVDERDGDGLLAERAHRLRPPKPPPRTTTTSEVSPQLASGDDHHTPAASCSLPKAPCSIWRTRSALIPSVEPARAASAPGRRARSDRARSPARGRSARRAAGAALRGARAMSRRRRRPRRADPRAGRRSSRPRPGRRRSAPPEARGRRSAAMSRPICSRLIPVDVESSATEGSWPFAWDKPARARLIRASWRTARSESTTGPHELARRAAASPGGPTIRRRPRTVSRGRVVALERAQESDDALLHELRALDRRRAGVVRATPAISGLNASSSASRASASRWAAVTRSSSQQRARSR